MVFYFYLFFAWKGECKMSPITKMYMYTIGVQQNIGGQKIERTENR